MADVTARLAIIVENGQAIASHNQYDAAATKTIGIANSLTSTFAKLGLTFGAGIVLKKFVDESIAAQDAQAHLEAGLKSTGYAAGRSLVQLQGYASGLQDITTFSDEAVQGAQSLLLTFDRIKGDNFDHATRSVADLAERMGGDLSGAALQVGKALQDPEHGLTALTRSGVSFSDSQKEVIKHLDETGHSAEAQRLILAELDKEFGGSATAARDTLGGALKGLSHNFGELFEITRANSGGAIGAIDDLSSATKVLKQNLGLVEDGAEAVAAVVGARYLSAGIAAVLEMLAATVKSRAEEAAYAFEAARVARAKEVEAAAEVEAALARRASNAATIEAVEQERALQVALLESANALKAKAANQLAQPGLSTLGGAVVAREQEALARANQLVSDSTAELGALGVAQANINRDVAVTAHLYATAQVEAAVATDASIAAQTTYIATTSATTLAMETATTVAKGLWTAMGGWVGAGLIGLYAIYKTSTSHIEDAKRAQDELNDSTARGLQGLNAAQIASQYKIVQDQIRETKHLLDALPKASIIAGVPGGYVDPNADRRLGYQQDLNKLLEQEKTTRTALDAAIHANSASTHTDTDVTKEHAKAIRDLADANAERIEQARQALVLAGLEGIAQERVAVEYKAANDAIKARAQSREASISGDPFDLKATLASIEATRRLGHSLVDLHQTKDDADRAFVEGGEKLRAFIADQNKLTDNQKLEIKLTKEAAESFRRYMAERDKNIGQYVAKPDILPTHTWIDDAQKTLGIVQLIGTALSGAGNDFGRALTNAASGVQSILSGIENSRNAKSTGDIVGSIGGVAGGIFSIFSSVDQYMQNEKETVARAAEAQRAYNEALRDFAIVSRTALEQLNKEQIDKANQLARQAGFTVPFNSAADIASLIGKDRASGDKYLNERADVLQGILDTLGQNLDAIAKQIAQEVSAIGESNDVRQLRLDGLGIEADYLASVNEVQRQYAEAVAKYGDIAEVSRQRTLGLAEAEQKRAEAQAAEEKRLNRSLFDTATGTRAFTDPRRADQAAFEEAQRRRYEDAATAAEKFAIALYNAAEAADRNARLAETERRSVFSNVNEAIGYTDPRTANLAALLEEANNRVWDAIKAGASDAEIAAIRFRNAAALANYESKLLESDRRTSEGNAGTVFTALSGGRSAEDYTRSTSNRQANVDALGQSAFNRDFLLFSQRATDSNVAMQRAIEDGTATLNKQAAADIAENKAIIQSYKDRSAAEIAKIDEQIKADGSKFDALIASSQQAVTYAQQQIQLTEQSLQTAQKAYDANRNFVSNYALGNSSLSPTDRYAEAQRQFDTQFALAQTDREAAANFPSVIEALLRESKVNNASGAGFTADERKGLSAAQALADKYGTIVSAETIARDNAQAGLMAAQQQVQYLQDAKQIALDALNERKNGISKDAQSQIDKLDELNTSITDGLPTAIAKLVAEAQAANLQRIQDDPFYKYFSQFVGTGQEPANYGSPTLPMVVQPPSAPTPGEAAMVLQIAALTTQVGKLETQLAAIASSAKSLADTAGPQTQAVVDGLSDVVEAIGESAAVTRRSRDRAPVLTRG